MEPSELELAEAELELAEAVEVEPQKPKVESAVLRQPPANDDPSFVQSALGVQPNSGWVTEADIPTMGQNLRAAAQGASMGGIPLAIDTARQAIRNPVAAIKAIPSVVGGHLATGGGTTGFVDPTKYIEPDAPDRFESRDQYRADADRVPIAKIAGGLMNPMNIANPSTIAGNMGMGALQSYVEDQDPVNAAGAGLGSGVMAGGMRLLAGGAKSLYDSAMKKLTPAALRYVNELAESIAFQGSGTDADAFQALKKPGTSKMGLGSKMDDIKYALLNELNPTLMDSPSQLSDRLSDMTYEAGQQYGKAIDPIRMKTAPASQIQSEIQGVRDVLREDPYVRSGPDAAKMLGDLESRFVTTRAQPVDVPSVEQSGDLVEEFSPKPGLLDPRTNAPIEMEGGRFVQQDPVTSFAQQEKELPYSVIDEMKQSAKDQMYDKSDYGGMGVTSATKAGTTLVDALDNVMRGEMSPAQARVFDAANAKVARSEGLTQSMMPGLSARIGANPGVGTIGGGIIDRLVIDPTKGAVSRARIGAMNTVRGVANRGLNRLRSNGIKGLPSDEMAPLKIDDVQRKLEAIAKMPDADAVSYSYAESLVNPVFRQVWLEAQSDDDQ